MLSELFTSSFFKSLQQLKIRTRRSFLSTRQGTHRSLRRGHGLEFSDFRAYTPGDDFRHIDWGIYGRTDRLYVRQFSEEQDLNVLILLDTSNSMKYPEGEGKFELAKNIALSLGYVALTDGDTVAYGLLGGEKTPRFSGPKAIARALATISKVIPSGAVNLKHEIRRNLANEKIPGKCFLISDFLIPLEEFYDAMDYIRARNFDISIIQILSPSELKLNLTKNSFLAIDAETGKEIELALDRSSREEYAQALATHVARIEEYCYKAGIIHVLVASDEYIKDVILKKLPQLGILK
jgi:uncharacterized protein (DUF58 family)